MNSIEIEEFIGRSLRLDQGLHQYLFSIPSIAIANVIVFINDQIGSSGRPVMEPGNPINSDFCICLNLTP
jgi:hypothetical protein